MGAQVDVGVAQERQDRVVERRGRDLDLAAGDGLAILGDHAIQQLELHFAQLLLVVLGEAPILGHQPANAGVAVKIEGIDPGELVPDLQIAQVVAAETAGGGAAVCGRGQRAAAPRQELGVARIDVDHPLPLRVKETLEDEVDIVLVELGGRFHAQLQRPVAGAVRGKRLQLHQQRRHEVERHAHGGKLAQDRHHAVIILQGVQPHPRQDVLPGDEILVIRLVHVPQQSDASHRSSLNPQVSRLKSQRSRPQVAKV